MELITSSKNSSFRLLKDLKKRAVRETLRLTFIEGTRFVAEAMEVRWPVESIYVSLSFSRTTAFQILESSFDAIGSIPIILSDSLFQSASDTQTPQGILAVIRFLDCSVSDLFYRSANHGEMYVEGADACRTMIKDRPQAGDTNACRILILDGIQDPGNAGTMIRTAEAAGFSGVVLSDGCVDLYSPKTLRATMGSVFRVPIVVQANLPELICSLRERSITVYGTMPDVTLHCYNCDFSSDDFALVIGSEAFGIRKEVAELCDRLIQIPMPGNAESLNASIAASILMFEAVRRKLQSNQADKALT